MRDFNNNVVNELPDISKITFIKIEKSYLSVLLINIFLIFVPTLIGLVVLINLKLEEVIPEYTWLFYLVYFFVFAFIITTFCIGFSKRKYALREKDVSYKKGILLKKMTTVPFSRIQHVEINEGPISRLFKLASLSVFTAGDSSDDLEISGIQKTEALRIKEFISSKING